MKSGVSSSFLPEKKSGKKSGVRGRNPVSGEEIRCQGKKSGVSSSFLPEKTN